MTFNLGSSLVTSPRTPLEKPDVSFLNQNTTGPLVTEFILLPSFDFFKILVGVELYKRLRIQHTYEFTLRAFGSAFGVDPPISQ